MVLVGPRIGPKEPRMVLVGPGTVPSGPWMVLHGLIGPLGIPCIGPSRASKGFVGPYIGPYSALRALYGFALFDRASRDFIGPCKGPHRAMDRALQVYPQGLCKAICGTL